MSRFFNEKRGPDGPSRMAKGWSAEVLIIICVLCTALVAALIALVVAIIRAKVKDRHSCQDLEHGALDARRTPAMKSSSIRPAVPHQLLRRSAFLPFGSQYGWKNLHSRENLSKSFHQDPAIREHDTSVPKRRSSVPHLVWPFSKPALSQGNVPLNIADNTRLSTIVEGPASFSSRSPGIASDNQHTDVLHRARESEALRVASPLVSSTQQELFCSSPFAPSTKPSDIEPLKSEPLTVAKKKKRYRAQTVGATIRPVLPSPQRMDQTLGRNIYSHSRSFSLGSQNPGDVPQAPVPPLPLRVDRVQLARRPRSCGEVNPSRLSTSSLESIGSSLLAVSPRIQRNSNAWLKGGAKREYANSLITGPRPLRRNTNMSTVVRLSPEHNLQSLRGSIQSNLDRVSVPSLERKGLPRETSSNTLASSVQLSPVGNIATADAIRFSRVSIISTTDSSLPMPNTPKRQSRFSVAPNGSPAQRSTSVHQDTLTSHNVVAHQLSRASSRVSSTRSSNGNPFHFDPSPMASGKPSALKGSPNARNRGHRRQNCVRISVPALSKSPSPIMAGIQEESPELITKGYPDRSWGSSNRVLPRPPSSSTFAPDVKLSPTLLRASLTPSSPTLSMVPFGSDPPLNELSIPLATSSPESKDQNRHCKALSVFTIPTFPSPGKLTTNVTPTPTFSFTRPSCELDARPSPPTEFTRLAKFVAPDSPPAELLSQREESPNSSLDALDGAPLSSTTKGRNENHSRHRDADPAPLPLFATHPWPAPPDCNQKLAPISPPCSPKSMPSSPEMAICLETLTTQLGEGPDLQESVCTHPGHPLFRRSITAPIQQTNDVRSSHYTPPVRPVVESIFCLRRMNSEANRESAAHGTQAMKRWRRLGIREASPALDQNASRCGSCVSISTAAGATETRDSMADILEIDRLLEEDELRDVHEFEEEDGEACMEMLGSEDGDEKKMEVSKNLLIPRSSTDQRRGASEVSELKKENRASSVWEDGEYFWRAGPEHVQKGGLADVLPLVATVNSQNMSGRVSKVALPQRVSQMRKSAVMEKLAGALSGIGCPEVRLLPPSSDIGTPGSLYDENGFLKSS